MIASLEFRSWNDEDISFAKRMTDIEGWGNSLADFERLLEIEPNGCLVGLHDGERVGMITALAFGRYGFLGSLIVPAEYRGRQIGERLMRQGIDYLKGRECDTIELDGVIKAVPLYKRLGFQEKYHSLRFKRPGAPVKPGGNGLEMSDRVRGVNGADIAKVIEFDKASLGIDRSRALKAIYDLFPNSFSAVFGPSDELLAYLIVRPIDEVSCQLGALVSTENLASIQLLSHAITDYSAYDLSIGMPAMAGYISHWILRQGFIRYAPCLRMFIGKELNYEERVACILSPEKG